MNDYRTNWQMPAQPLGPKVKRPIKPPLGPDIRLKWFEEGDWLTAEMAREKFNGAAVSQESRAQPPALDQGCAVPPVQEEVWREGCNPDKAGAYLSVAVVSGEGAPAWHWNYQHNKAECSMQCRRWLDTEAT